jgi:hypothetical protein
VTELVSHDGREAHAIGTPTPTRGIDVDLDDSRRVLTEEEIGEIGDDDGNSIEIGRRVRHRPLGDRADGDEVERRLRQRSGEAIERWRVRRDHRFGEKARRHGDVGRGR